MPRKRKWLGLFALLMMHPSYAYCENYSHTIQFNDNQAYTYNYAWKHSLDQFPVGSSIKSASLELRVQVWYWGMNIYEQNIDIMVSDTTSFTLPQDRVCELNPSSNPNPSNFYTVTCPLPSSVFASIENDGEIYIGTNTYSGTYYLDYSTLTINSDAVEKYSLTVNVYPSGSGYVTLNPSSQTYNSGEIVTLSAVNNAGYIFDHWVGDVSNTLQTTTTAEATRSPSRASLASPPISSSSRGKRTAFLWCRKTP